MYVYIQYILASNMNWQQFKNAASIQAVLIHTSSLLKKHTALDIQGHSDFSHTPIQQRQTSHSIFAIYSLRSLLLVTSHSTLLKHKTHTHKAMPRTRGGIHFLHLLLLSFTSSLLLWSTTVPLGVICQCLTWGVTPPLITADCSCELCFGGEKAKLQGAETDSRGAADLLAPLSPLLAMKPFSLAYQH